MSLPNSSNNSNGNPASSWFKAFTVIKQPQSTESVPSNFQIEHYAFYWDKIDGRVASHLIKGEPGTESRISPSLIGLRASD